MPDPWKIAMGVGVAALAAAFLSLLGVWLGRARHPGWRSAGGALGMALGIWLGCLVLGLVPHWPPREDQDRLLLLILPGLCALELMTACSGVPRRLVGALRFLAGSSIAPVLLAGTTYLSDVAGPGTREWSTGLAFLVLAGIALAFAATCWLVNRVQRESCGVSISLSIALVLGGAALTIMLSGYATGGQIGLVMAAAVGGCSIVTPIDPDPARGSAPITAALGLLLGLLLMGRFFGELRTPHALSLSVAPLLCALPDLILFIRRHRILGGLLRPILVALVVAGVLFLAQRRFVADSRATHPPGAVEPSLDDYMQFGR